MSVLIDSIDITGLVNSDLFPTGLDTVSEVSSEGSLIVYEKQISYSQIDLVGGSDWGWLSLSVLQSLQNLAKISGAIYTLNYEGDLIDVRFRTEDPPVISADKLINRSNQDGTDWYNNITIKLIGV
jgi:hypothetical protein